MVRYGFVRIAVPDFATLSNKKWKVRLQGGKNCRCLHLEVGGHLIRGSVTP